MFMHPFLMLLLLHLVCAYFGAKHLIHSMLFDYRDLPQLKDFLDSYEDVNKAERVLWRIVLFMNLLGFYICFEVWNVFIIVKSWFGKND